MYFPVPQDVLACLTTLKTTGFDAWFVGGAVRDALRGVAPHDYDIASNASPSQVAALFEHTVPTGRKHGTMTVLVPSGSVEITSFRVETGYTDGRHPDQVRFIDDIRADLSRRDFTMNAVAYDPDRGLCDPYGGQRDIAKKCIRAVGPPARRFAEDALRILRAYRFACTLQFEIERETAAAACAAKRSLQTISRERILAELRRAVCAKAPEALTPFLRADGLAFVGLGAPSSALDNLGRMPQDDALRFAALFFCCHAQPAACLEALRASKRLRRRTVLFYDALRLQDQPDARALKGLLAALPVGDVYALLAARAVLRGEDAARSTALLSEILAQDQPYALGQLAVRGDDLTAIGARGAMVGELLNALLQHVLQHPQDNTRDALLALARRLRADKE